jgi:hypothetical protein
MHVGVDFGADGVVRVGRTLHVALVHGGDVNLDVGTQAAHLAYLALSPTFPLDGNAVFIQYRAAVPHTLK